MIQTTSHFHLHTILDSLHVAYTARQRAEVFSESMEIRSKLAQIEGAQIASKQFIMY